MERRNVLKALVAGVPLSLIPTRQLLAQTSGKQMAMVIDTRRCTGCGSCTVSCAVENNTDLDRSRTVVRQAVIEDNDGHHSTLTVPTQCVHCQNPPCLDACPVQATDKLPSGEVYINYETCINCQLCVDACPYGARKRDISFKSPPEKCNFCVGRTSQGLLPACVESCIGKARVFGDLNDSGSHVARLVSENKTYGLLAEKGTRPALLYIGLPSNIDDEIILKINAQEWQR